MLSLYIFVDLEWENHNQSVWARQDLSITQLLLNLTTSGKNKCLLTVHFKLCLFSPVLFELLNNILFHTLGWSTPYHKGRVSPAPSSLTLCSLQRINSWWSAQRQSALWDLTRDEGWRETRHLRPLPACAQVRETGRSQAPFRHPNLFVFQERQKPRLRLLRGSTETKLKRAFLSFNARDIEVNMLLSRVGT